MYLKVVEELRSCNDDYVFGDDSQGLGPLKMAILGSKAHLCINKNVMERHQNGQASVDEVSRLMPRPSHIVYRHVENC
jgi:hypothetical protein